MLAATVIIAVWVAHLHQRGQWARIPSTHAAIRSILHGVVAYYQDRGSWPDQDHWESELVDGQYIEIVRKSKREGAFPTVDAWGHSIQYRYPSVSGKDIVDVYSVGPNGIDEGGGGDDIGHWETGTVPHLLTDAVR